MAAAPSFPAATGCLLLPSLSCSLSVSGPLPPIHPSLALLSLSLSHALPSAAAFPTHSTASPPPLLLRTNLAVVLTAAGCPPSPCRRGRQPLPTLEDGRGCCCFFLFPPFRPPRVAGEEEEEEGLPAPSLPPFAAILVDYMPGTGNAPAAHAAGAAASAAGRPFAGVRRTLRRRRVSRPRPTRAGPKPNASFFALNTLTAGASWSHQCFPVRRWHDLALCPSSHQWGMLLSAALPSPYPPLPIASLSFSLSLIPLC